jgi:biofilm PGA synthesis N-glycosyltransferase PgaC
MPSRLLIISPCRNEEKFIELTLRSVIEQTNRPNRWIIVDDASTDSSPEIVARYAAEYPWIELVRRKRGGERQMGPGVIAAFNEGLERARGYEYDVIAKTDCDVEFPPDAFEKILEKLEEPHVGMTGGAVHLMIGERLFFERYAPYHISGASKFYRRACFEQIGGLQPVYGWDILDETDARRHGWRTITLDEITIKHHRLQGSAFGRIRGRVIWGWGAYAVGSHPLFAISRGIFRMAEPPWIIGGLAVIWGFFSSYFKRSIKRTPDRELIKYLRREQLYRMFHGNRLPPEKESKRQGEDV